MPWYSNTSTGRKTYNPNSMNKTKKELQVLNISNSQEQAGAYALVLGEVDGDRQLPVIIGSNEAQYIVIELRGIVPPRPLTHNLFASVLEAMGAKLMRVLIYRVENGIFYSYIYLKYGENIMRVDARTSDAVALALRMNAPILVYEEILEQEGIRMEDFIEKETSASPRKPTLQSLEAALQKAVESEDYELAAQLRDQINQLKTP